MITPPLPMNLSASIPELERKRRVLLVDTSSRKRELRAETMRKLGIDVDSAADIVEARCWWKADLYDLVLFNVANVRGDRDRFCDDIRAAAPRRRVAFLVGKPEYVSVSPSPDADIQEADEEGPPTDVTAALSIDLADLPQRWGILEASRRISAVRSASAARTRAVRDRPTPPRDPEGRPPKRLPLTLDELLKKEEWQ